jgi:predicted Zn-dependent protease with MMP-like domain
MVRLTAEEFDRLVEESLAVVPPRFRRRLKNVVLVVEPEPPRPGLLGLYEGRPLPSRSVAEPFAMPDRITIYQGPHERLARNYMDLRRLVEETVWHEVAHYFGMDERRVRRAEVARRRKML